MSLRELLASPESVGVWTLIPDRSAIGLKAKSFYGLLPVKGSFREFSGDGQITEGPRVFGRIDIKAASLDTKIKWRDRDLRARRFFDVEKYADISVVVTNAESIDDDTAELRADLTVKGTTAPLPLKANVSVLDDGAVRIITEAHISRNDFGVGGNTLGMIPAGTTLTADVVFRRAGA